MTTMRTAERDTKRRYRDTHPWITFSIDLRPTHPETWMLLGEARSKIEHVAGSLLTPETAQEMQIVYLTKGLLATTAIEGNTLSEEEARRRLEGQLELPPSREYLGREIDNVLTGFNGIRDELLAGTASSLSCDTIAEYNRIVLDSLTVDEGVAPGEISTHPVVVGGYAGAPREDCAFLLDRLCDWLNGPDFEPRDPAWSLPLALVKAILAHLYLAWIHPFGDGNGRTARLVELRILLEAGVPTPATHLLSNHYNQTRSEYYRQLALASRSGGDVLPFVHYALQGFVDGLHDQLAVIREQQFRDRWEQYVHQRFGSANTPAKARQRQLVLDMPASDEPVPKTAIRRLSPELAEMYSGKTEKTLTRDLNAVVELGLVRRVDPRGYTANRHVIEAFLPMQAA